jgi:dephospho-CoA kinase
MERNHLSTNDAQARIDAQISDDARMQHSDFIIDTSSGLKPLKDRLNKIAQTLLMEI